MYINKFVVDVVNPRYQVTSKNKLVAIMVTTQSHHAFCKNILHYTGFDKYKKPKK